MWSHGKKCFGGEISTKIDIDKAIYDLYDEYCHGYMSRREFLGRASAITVTGITGLAMAQALLPRYAEAQTISVTDDRIKANYIEYDSPGGTTGHMRGYLVRPATEGPFSSVIVIHEIRSCAKVEQKVICALSLSWHSPWFS